MYVHTYIYIYVYIHICIHIYMYIYIRVISHKRALYFPQTSPCIDVHAHILHTHVQIKHRNTYGKGGERGVSIVYNSNKIWINGFANECVYACVWVCARACARVRFFLCDIMMNVSHKYMRVRVYSCACTHLSVSVIPVDTFPSVALVVGDRELTSRHVRLRYHWVLLIVCGMCGNVSVIPL